MLGLLGLIWGSSFIYMKMASQLISPLQIILLRLVCGLVPIALYAYGKGALKWDHRKHIVHFLVMAVVGTIGYYYGFTKGTSLLLSGVAGALSGLTPILSFLFALIFLEGERASLQKVLGISLGFLGVVFIAQPFRADIAAGLVLGLGVLGTGVAYILYYYIIGKLGAVSASSVAYIPPVVAIAIGVFFAGEQIALLEYAGAALILTGVVLVNRQPARMRSGASTA